MQHSIEQFQAMGSHTNAGAAQAHLASVELSGGEPARVLPRLLEADAKLAEIGEQGFRSTLQAALAQVYERLDNPDGARASIGLSEELGGADDLLNVVLTAAVRARLALSDGDRDAAERWARSAVEHAFRTDHTLLQGNAQLELARVLQALGRREEAIPHASAALELFQAKGDQPASRESQALLDRLIARN